MGMVQGSILGPILYSLFVSPLLDLAKIVLFAEDNYILTWNKHRGQLIIEMQTKLGIITKWPKDWGLNGAKSKTELCLFHQKNQPPIQIELKNQLVASKNTSKFNMIVHGVAAKLANSY